MLKVKQMPSSVNMGEKRWSQVSFMLVHLQLKKTSLKGGAICEENKEEIQILSTISKFLTSIKYSMVLKLVVLLPVLCKWLSQIRETSENFCNLQLTIIKHFCRS
jgi:hypothetical protein